MEKGQICTGMEDILVAIFGKSRQFTILPKKNVGIEV